MTTLDDIAGFLGGQNSSFSPAKRLEEDTGLAPVEQKEEKSAVEQETGLAAPKEEAVEVAAPVEEKPAELVAKVPPPLFTENPSYVDPLKGSYEEIKKNVVNETRHFFLQPLHLRREFK